MNSFFGEFRQLDIDSDGKTSVKMKKNSQLPERSASQYRPSNYYRGQIYQYSSFQARKNYRPSYNTYNGGNNAYHQSQRYGQSFDRSVNEWNRDGPPSPQPYRKYFCRRCGQYGHTSIICYDVEQTRNVGRSVPFNCYPKN